MPVLSTLGAAIANVYGFTSGLIKDQYFNLVSLLLPGNGTNGAQNNTFLDGSSNNFTITRNGNATQGTFSPFSQTGWGNYFDGNGDYLSATANAAFDFGTGDFTIEAWVYTDGTTETFGKRVVNKYVSNGWLLEVLRTSGNTVRFLWVNSSNVTVADIGTNDALTAFTWHHIAVSRSGANISLYVDGSRKATSSSVSGGTDNVSNNLLIGSANLADTHFDGYISNARLVKGTAVYDPTLTSITVPTAPLTAITNTSLLTCQSNRFRDASNNNFPITRNGDTSVVAFSPFAPTAKYETAAVGGSGYFDGTGDYLTWTGTAAGSGAFSYEFWIYSTNGFGTFRAPLGVIATSGYNSALDCRMSGTTITAGQYNVTNNNFTVESLQANTWYHVVICRNASNQMTVFLNGQRSSTGALTISTNFSGLTSAIGRLDPSNGGDVTGYITNVRLITGSTPYDPTQTTITVPTAPLTAITNTSLLLNFTNAGVVDATAKNVLETVGNAQISTSVSKFGGGSISFDGTSNTGLKAPAGNLFTFGSGAFTVEFWVRFNSVAADQAVLNVTGTTNVLTFYVLSTGSLNYYLSSNGSTYDIASGVSVGSISTGQWYRVALVRSGNTFTPYLNTTAGTTSTSSSALATPSSGTFLHLGMSTAGTSNFNGYIDDVRVTRGVARDMTVLPSAPFPVQ
jgi:hypothetical protein